VHRSISNHLAYTRSMRSKLFPKLFSRRFEAYNYSMTPIPCNYQIFHMNHSYFIFVAMNSTIHRSMGHDTMKMPSSLIIKNGTIPLRYHFTVISNLSKFIKRLFRMSTIVRYSSLCLLGILINSNGFANTLNIGQLLNLIFSNLFQKCSLMFIFVQLIKVILKFSYHYIIHSKSMLPVSFTQNMAYVANFYKMITSIFATDHRLQLIFIIYSNCHPYGGPYPSDY